MYEHFKQCENYGIFNGIFLNSNRLRSGLTDVDEVNHFSELLRIPPEVS